MLWVIPAELQIRLALTERQTDKVRDVYIDGTVHRNEGFKKPQDEALSNECYITIQPPQVTFQLIK